MAQSFLNQPGLPLGLRNNNPGNLRPLSGGQKWQGEIEPLNNFSRFQDVAYGIRAMITDITGDIVKDGKDTLRKLITVYAPPGENDTNAYIANVARLTGLNPDQIITPSAYWITKIIRAKMQVELGANYAGMILTSDINEGFDRLSDQVKVWLNYIRPSSGNAFFYALIAGAAIAWLLRR